MRIEGLNGGKEGLKDDLGNKMTAAHLRAAAGAMVAAAIALVAIAQLNVPAYAEEERRVSLRMCSGSNRVTCVVDGDTIWLDGVNLRLEGFDTPEPHTAICGGQAEVALAKRASARLLELLNSNAFTVTTGGLDGTGRRTLATIRIAGRDVGDILIDEGLARRWPDGREWWCS